MLNKKNLRTIMDDNNGSVIIVFAVVVMSLIVFSLLGAEVSTISRAISSYESHASRTVEITSRHYPRIRDDKIQAYITANGVFPDPGDLTIIDSEARNDARALGARFLAANREIQPTATQIDEQIFSFDGDCAEFTADIFQFALISKIIFIESFQADVDRANDVRDRFATQCP